jgi:hypothetical protein
MSVTPPARVRVRTTAGWQDISFKGGPGPRGPAGGPGPPATWTALTQAEYDALTTPDPTELYVITEDPAPAPGSKRMVILNEADAIYLGDRPASAVYLGDEQVWPPPDLYTPAVLADSPVAFWPLDDGQGVTIARDLVGNHPGTYPVNTQTEPGPGRLPRRRALLSGGGAFPVHVEVPHSSALAPPSFSIEIWMRTRMGLGSIGMVFTKVRSPWWSDPYQLMQINNRITFAVGTAAGESYVEGPQVYAGLPTFENWVYLVGVYDDAAQQASLYVDGVHHDSQNIVGAPAQGTSPVAFGFRTVDPYGFHGGLALAALYDYPLSGAQIGNHYAAMT